MKRQFVLVLTFLLILIPLFPQSPGTISYQGVVRNIDGSPIVNQQVSFRFTLLDNLDIAVWTETRQTTTSDLGIVTLAIGETDPLLLEAINWAAGGYSLKIECDPAGGTNYTISDTSL
ncbi:MAG: hypothetical protein R2744_13420 [Bacteroidales bacterium]